MITATCSMCHNELNDPGALIFGPPKNTNWREPPPEPSEVQKFHICWHCWGPILDLIIGAT